MSQYAYIGFGGPSLEDHKLFRHELNLSHLVSIESEREVFERQKINIPLDGLLCHHLTSSELVSRLETIIEEAGIGSDRNIIAWLDYVSPKDLKGQFGELQELLGKLQSGDIGRITVNANPRSLGESVGENHPDIQSTRLACLRERIGDLLPVDVDSVDVETNRYPQLLFRVMKRVCSQALSGRNLSFVPILQEVYADGQQMASVSGIVLTSNDIGGFLDTTGLSSWEFYSANWTAVEHIDFPDLTIRERLQWDRLSATEGDGDVIREFSAAFGTEEDTLQIFRGYKRYQRFLPHFHHIVY